MSEHTLERRQVLAGAARAGGVAALTGPAARPASAAVPDTADPFLLGIASGDPLPTSVILWTRLVRNPYDARALSRPVVVDWQVAADERFRHPVRQGPVLPPPELAPPLHLDARRPLPRREDLYPLRPPREPSPVRRTPTPPA